jgi:hypothetical protein
VVVAAVWLACPLALFAGSALALPYGSIVLSRGGLLQGGQALQITGKQVPFGGILGLTCTARFGQATGFGFANQLGSASADGRFLAVGVRVHVWSMCTAQLCFALNSLHA